MNDCQTLHETIVRDVIDVMDNVKNFDQVEWLQTKNRTGSIARRASNLILVFPVIVSNSLSIASATLVTKAIERKCVSLMQILFSSIQYARGVEDMDDYIRLFHSNLNAPMSFDDFIASVDRLAESGEIEVVDRVAYEAVMEDMRNINYVLSNDFNPISINDYSVKHTNVNESHVYVKPQIQPITEARSNNRRRNNNQPKPAGLTKGEIERIASDTADRAFSRQASRFAKATTSVKDDVDYFRYQLNTNDVQKANELAPTTMIVNFVSVVDGTKYTTSGVVGIKAKMYPVDAMDIVNRISSKVSDTNTLFSLIKASTREISFFKDFAFAIEKAKTDAINMSRESNNAKIFKLLERRAAKNKFSTLLKKNDASPITSLVMSQEEVEYLRKYNSLDMEKSYVTRKILEGYNLMDIVLVDESLEVARFLYDDGDGVFEALSFDALDRESKDGGAYKKVINLMSKMNR